ncbi:rod shape-determining protein MreC [Paenibacillus turpanensis]|uniref:rod shape-determining protein MreC n=1 Tax=Paenibacillus turpanensis TaxID=2689078 RepID=UPI00140C98E0|nr:rod shape-determining protein MreC [Paenibacillus turpanensis]
MFKLMGNKRLIFLMAGIIFFIAIMGLSYGQREKVTAPEMFVKDTVSFLQGLVYTPVRMVSEFLEDVRDLRTLYVENRELKLTLSQYARDSARLNELEAQNIRLKEELEFTERQKAANNYKYRIAEVIADNSSDPYNQTITINLGEKDGIRPDMAVTSVDGLVGRVVRVFPFHSNVQLITNLDSESNQTKAIAATVMGNNDSFGMIETFEDGKLVMTKIIQSDELKEGDTVITSGLGQVFPSGIPIGKVVSRKVGDFGLTYTALIEPASSFTHLREVFVIEVPE